jgi:hypothetical protein
MEAYADVKPDVTYEWHFMGVVYDSNIVDLPFGKRTTEADPKIILIMTNSGASDQDVGYYIKGWARSKP